MLREATIRFSEVDRGATLGEERPGPLDVHFGVLTEIREIQEAPTVPVRAGVEG